MEVKITKENFENEVLKSEIPVLLDFFATWCGPCKMLSPILEEIAKENAGKIKVCKVDVDEEGELASAFRVQSIPTLVAFKDGKAVNMAVGYRKKEDLLAMFD